MNITKLLTIAESVIVSCALLVCAAAQGDDSNTAGASDDAIAAQEGTSAQEQNFDVEAYKKFVQEVKNKVKLFCAEKGGEQFHFVDFYYVDYYPKGSAKPGLTEGEEADRRLPDVIVIYGCHIEEKARLNYMGGGDAYFYCDAKTGEVLYYAFQV